MLYFRNQETSAMGRLLKEELTKAGLRFVDSSDGSGLWTSTYDAVISYGVPLPRDIVESKPCLNAVAGGTDKLTELKKFKEAGVACVPFRHPSETIDLAFPLLRRKFYHMKGKDIVVIKNARELQKYFRRDRFYTQVVPSKTEYRVWVFRDKAIATYEKVLKYPERNRAFGRNFSNGYAFEFRSSDVVSDDMKRLAKAAIKARGLDFGAVDVLETKDYPDKFVILETNSAPGVEGPGRVCVVNLVRKICEWVAQGYPQRRPSGGEAR